MTLEDEQRAVCRKYGASYWPCARGSKVGVARNVLAGDLPLNGLRHPAERGTCGWYIWAGEELSESPDFFVPLHVEHLQESCPIVLRFLGLAPGWRFLVAEGYEDVWEDASLLNV
jgi:hypothetical protein